MYRTRGRIQKICKQCRGSFSLPRCYQKRISTCSKECQRLSRTMEANARWNGGVKINHGGYRMIRVKGQKEYVFEHRLIMENILGRPLTQDEIVHHKNHDRLDNRPKNLELTTRQEHHGVIHLDVAMANLAKTPSHRGRGV